MRFAALSLLPLVALIAACSGDADAPDGAQPTAAETAVAAAAPAGPFAPRNDCAGIPGAQAFLDQINTAVAARDVDAFVNLADVHVRLGFGGEDGAANLRQSLEMPDGGMWDEIAELMAMGCAVSDAGEFTTITLPWYFAQNMDGDPFETMIVTGENVGLHAAADAGSPVLASVSWDMVQLIPEAGADGAITFGGPDDSGWRHVRLEQAGGAEPVEG